jgi:hypothetical protein
MPMKTTNLVESLARSSSSKQSLERRLIQIGLGVISALERSEMSFDDAWQELFNLDNYQEIKRRRLDKRVRDFFQWGMELEDVAAQVPAHIEESYQAMRKIAGNVLKDVPTRRPQPVHRSPLRKSA